MTIDDWESAPKQLKIVYPRHQRLSKLGRRTLDFFRRGAPGSQTVWSDNLKVTPNFEYMVYGMLYGMEDIIKECWKIGANVYHVDHAYFIRGHKNGNYRISKNRLQAGKIIPRPDNRRKRLNIKLKPWQTSGKHILVCPPTNAISNFWNLSTWLDETVATLKQHTDRPIVIRKKPNLLKPGVKLLTDDLANCHALVTFSSNAAVEAAVDGIPVFVSTNSAAYPIGLTDFTKIETPVYPDREEWLNHLAYSQFNLQEIRNYTAWRILSGTRD